MMPRRNTDGMPRQREYWVRVLAGYSPLHPLLLSRHRYRAVRRILNGGRFGRVRQELYAAVLHQARLASFRRTMASVAVARL